jgi:signal transduction histidine kinase
MEEPIRTLSRRTLAFNEVVYGREEQLTGRPPAVPILVAGGLILVALVLFGLGMRTERRRAQAAIELERDKLTAEEDLKGVAALAPPMFIVNAEDRIVFTSNLADVFVDSLPQDDSRALLDLIADGARRLRVGEGGRATPQSFVPATGPTDAPRAVEVQFSQVDWHGVPAVMALIVEETWIRDEIRQYTARIAQSRVTSAIRELAHELKQPIWLIDLATNNLMRRSTPEMRREIEGPVSKIQRGVERMNSIINAFRDEGNEGERSASFNLRTAIDSALSLASGMLRQHGVELRYTPGPAAELSAFGSQTLFEQALLNLVANACEAHGSDGSGPKQPTVDVNVARRGETARVSVSDNAGGLHEAIADPFTPGITTKGGGDTVRGIGLPFTRKVVEEMDGSIEFTNVPGEGVTFIVELPVADERGGGEAASAPPGERQALG